MGEWTRLPFPPSEIRSMGAFRQLARRKGVRRSAPRPRRALGLEPLESRELLATASIVVDEYKFVQFTIADGTFSGNNSIQQPGSPTWQDSYSKKSGTASSDNGFIKYLSATSGVGAFQAGSGQ